MHPIFQWLDYQYDDYGVFGRVTDDRRIGEFRNRFIAGVNVHNGRIDNRQFANIRGFKGALLSSSIDRAENTSAYVENSLFVLPNVAVIGGTQFIHATRSRRDRFLSNGDQSGATEFNLWSPRAGLLWDIDPTWQAFANISRSAEIPSFGESSSFPAPVIPFTSIRPQRATTYEIGTRGRRPDLFWELTGYRAEIKDEFLCLYSAFGNCNVDQRRPDVSIRVSKPALGCRRAEEPVRAGRGGPAVAAVRLHVQRLPLRRRSGLRQQPAARRAAALSARGAALQASVRLLFRAEPRMGAGKLLRRQRQHAEDRGRMPCGA